MAGWSSKEKWLMERLQKEALEDAKIDSIIKGFKQIGGIDPGKETEKYEKKKGGSVRRKKGSTVSRKGGGKVMQGYKAGGKV